MIDPNLLINDFDETSRRIQRKGASAEEIAAARDAHVQRNALLRKVEELRSERNATSKEIGQLMAAGEKDKAEVAKAKVSSLKSTLDEMENELRTVEETARDRILRLPNLPDDACPDGLNEDSNVVKTVVGYDPKDYEGRTFRPHWDVAGDLGIFDQERASKISGSMFALLHGQGSKLLRALVKLAFDLNENTYEEQLVPTVVNSATFTGTGHLPKFENDAYRMRDDDLWAIPTGEVPLTAMHRDEILPGDALPLRYMAYTSCFRREAGSAGKDTRGLQRLHEFHKVELVRLCKPEDAQQEFNELLADAIRPIELLKLPYRIVDLCAGDLTFSSTRIFDIEVYAPGVDCWLEVSSVGIFSDFQMRRSNIRFRRDASSKTEFPYALNGSAIATPRVWAAIIEHYQELDGSVRVPDVLVDFMDTDRIVPRG